MTATELRVLGPLEVVGDDGHVPLAGKHLRLLAALTISAGRTRPVDELVEALWDGDAPASARKLVQVYVSQLRKALPPGVAITTSSASYAVELDPGVLDAERFETLLAECGAARDAGNPALAASLAEQALALWRGRAYGDFGYEDFAHAESERLEELRLAALEERLAAQLALGRHADVLGEALALAEESPFRERAHELAMLALYRSGRQADALDHYAAFRAQLDAELGLEPGPELRELQRQILNQDAALAAPDEPAPSVAALPTPPNPLVGRERELAELHALLGRRDARLVVMTGAGGSGKTRLALEAARESAGTYANGALVVELAPLRDAELVLPTIAQAVGVSADRGEDVLETVVDALSAKELLLLIDNAEHVREAASVFPQLVARAPRLTLLVTSRAVLHVSGEHVFQVEPLADTDALELFAQRARLLDPSFEITQQNEADIRDICGRVDRLPLAIELAAARVRTLTPRVLRERLDDRLGVLTGGPRDVPARQQTLRETIEWSVALLGPHERNVLAALSTFPAGATLDAAEDVCGADIDTLSALVGDSLVRRDDMGGALRFEMLETVREFTLELLGGERHSTELAMAEYFARRGDELRQFAPDERAWRRLVDDLDREADNIRVALAAAVAAEDVELKLRLAGGLWRYWAIRGPVGEGLAWIERALAAEGPATAARACALQGGAGLAWRLGDDDRARGLAEAAVPIAIEAGSAWDERSAHTILGILAKARNDFPAARRHHQRAIEITEGLGFEPVIEMQNLGSVALEAREYPEATARFEDVLERARRNDNVWATALAHLGLGIAQYELGDLERSRLAFEGAMEISEALGLRDLLAHSWQGLAVVRAHESDFESAAFLLGRARGVLDEFGGPEDLFWDERLPETRAQAREALGDERFQAVYEAGREDSA